MITEVVDLQYFPNIDWFKKVKTTSNLKIFVYGRFRKMTFTNRMMIAGANGLISLSIPIKGGREKKQLLQEVEIDDSSNWKIKHWRAIESSYSRAPFYEYYAPTIKELILKEESNLVVFANEIIDRLCKALEFNIVTEIATEIINVEVGNNEGSLPKNFQKEENWKPRYSQVFESKYGFQQNLSIIDLLFNEGPNAKILLNQVV